MEGRGWRSRGKVCEYACQLSDVEQNFGTLGTSELENAEHRLVSSVIKGDP